MKTLNIADAPKSVPELLALADQENLVLRTPDGRQYVLAELDDFDHEVALTRENAELMALLDERSKERGSISLAEARRRLGV
jgi:hypothetical protein